MVQNDFFCGDEFSTDVNKLGSYFVGDCGDTIAITVDQVARVNGDSANVDGNMDIDDMTVAVRRIGAVAERGESDRPDLVEISCRPAGNQSHCTENFIGGAHNLPKRSSRCRVIQILEDDHGWPRYLSKRFDLSVQAAVFPSINGRSICTPRGRRRISNRRGHLREARLDRVIHAGYALLGLQTYFTAGVKEVRAWTIPIAATAPQAAGKIHTDFERGFIKAEIYHYDELIEYRSELKLKEAGKIRQEGKSYTVIDGDIIFFKFNV